MNLKSFVYAVDRCMLSLETQKNTYTVLFDHGLIFFINFCKCYIFLQHGLMRSDLISLVSMSLVDVDQGRD